MAFFTSLLIALVLWALVAWLCGMALGRMIGLMQGDEEPDEPWWAPA